VPFCALGKHIFWPPQNSRLPLSVGAGFLLFDRTVGAFPLEGLVASTGPLCPVGRKVSWHQQNSKGWSMGFTCVYGRQVEGACGAAKPVGLNHLVSTRQWGPWGLLVLGHGLPGATGAAAVTREQSFRATKALGLCPGEQYSSWCQPRGNQAYWLAPSATHGAAEALGPAYIRAPVSLVSG
jgi:hypothetical protein